MKKVITNLLSLIAMVSAMGQNVQYASRLVDFSSQVTNKQNSAEQILGKPDAMPQGGKSGCAWSPQNASSAYEYIEVGFEKPMKIKQIAIFENFCPGAVYQVTAKDEKGKVQKIYKGKPLEKAENKAIFYIHLDELTGYEVHSLKLELNCQAVSGPNQIDAIAISDSDEPVVAKINLIDAELFESEPENLGENVNTAYADFMPVVTPDGQTLYFLRRDYPKNVGGGSDDIWVSDYINGKWSLAKNIGPPLNNNRVNSVSSVLPDGNNMLLIWYAEDGSSEHGIHTSQRAIDGWQQPQILQVENFFNYNIHNEYYMANDGKTLLMTVERDFSLGGKDLYVSFKKEDGTWSEPQSLGKELNTVEDETSPFLAADMKTLYFSTSGYPGYGSDDIYMTRRLDDSWTKWSEPVNMGEIINTPNWDAYYTIPASGEYAYFVSNQNSYGRSDIFRIKLPSQAKPEPVVLIRGRVLDAKTNEPVGTAIEYESLPGGKNMGIANSDPKSGNYQIVLPYGIKYGFHASARGYYAINQFIDLTEVKEYAEIKRDILMAPIEVGQIVRLNNIFFEFGKSILLEESFAELNRVVKLMKENITMKIEIAGHTDNVGSDAENLTLSNNRAKAVVDYLVSQGIDDSRLVSKGYGETQPIDTNETDEGRAFNRRVEFRILNM